jgi:hypothetical protein
VEDALSQNSQFALLISEFAFVVANLFLVAKNKSPMDKDYLILKRAALSRPSGEWDDDDFDVLASGAVVGRIFKVNASRNEVARETVSTERPGMEPADFCSHHTKREFAIQVTYGGYCACNRNATCFGADHSPFGRRPSHHPERAELRSRNSR